MPDIFFIEDDWNQTKNLSYFINLLTVFYNIFLNWKFVLNKMEN